jgi:hypothetical protein
MTPAFIQKAVSFRRESSFGVQFGAMPSEEEEMSLTKWRDLLGTELMIALQELAKIHKNGANKRHQHYVESCAEQYWKTIMRITGAKKEESLDSDRLPMFGAGNISSILGDARPRAVDAPGVRFQFRRAKN